MSTIDDLSPEQMEQIEKRMQKGAFSETGFLSSRERLKNIIEQDKQTLQRLGITHKQVADRLESIVGKAERLEQLAQRGQLVIGQEPANNSRKNLWDTIKKYFTQDVRKGTSGNVFLVENLYSVSEFGYLGIQRCPFLNHDGKSCQQVTTCDYSIENTETGIKISFSGLIMHLVRDHHFFEGSVKYRLEPEQTIMILKIQPGQDYSPTYVTEKIWIRGQGTTQNYAELERGEKLAYQTAVNSADEIIKLSDTTCIYFWNEICVTVSDIDYLISKELIVAEGYWTDNKIERGVWVYKPQKNTYVAL